MKNNTITMTVQLNKEQMESLRFYTGINANIFIATREDTLNHLSMFLSKNELNYLKANDCNYTVTFKAE